MASALPAALPASDADRLAALFDAHHDRLYRLARRLAPTADDALDLVQEAFLKAARCCKSAFTAVRCDDRKRWMSGSSAGQTAT